jgi:hypothetical protein
LTDFRCRLAVEEAERYADDEAALEAMQRAQAAVRFRDRASVAYLAYLAAGEYPNSVAWSSRQYQLKLEPGLDGNEVEAAQARLVREIAGNPFRPATLSPACLTSDVSLIALAAYGAGRQPSGHLDNARLAVLSDALEEAGCSDADILSHLRSPGPHVRGCWVLDLVLGKS